MTPLHYAAAFDRVGVLNALLNKGAATEAKGEVRTPSQKGPQPRICARVVGCPFHVSAAVVWCAACELTSEWQCVFVDREGWSS